MYQLDWKNQNKEDGKEFKILDVSLVKKEDLPNSKTRWKLIKITKRLEESEE